MTHAYNTYISQTYIYIHHTHTHMHTDMYHTPIHTTHRNTETCTHTHTHTHTHTLTLLPICTHMPGKETFPDFWLTFRACATFRELKAGTVF